MNRSDETDARAEILHVDAEWSAAAATGDLERILSYWDEDASIFPPGGPAVVGKPAIREYVAASFATPGFQISWRTNEVAVSRGGDLAYGVGTNRVSLTGADGKPVTIEGKAVTVWRRDARGEWKCIVDIWNDASAPPR